MVITMNLRAALLSLSLTVALASLYNSEAFAQTVRTLSPEQAQGRETGLVTIPLSPGTGINISFIGMNAIIEKAWLDNPSWLTLDSDGCLVSSLSSTPVSSPAAGQSGSARSPRSELTCWAPSSVLHLRRINELKIPGLPSVPETTLSVITRDPDGVRQISVFRLVRGHSTFHTVEVVSNLAPPPPPQAISVDLALVQRGRQAAIDANFLRSGDPLDSKILNFINFLANGTASDVAMSRSGISLKLVNKLTELGRSVSIPPVDSKKEASVAPSPQGSLVPVSANSSL
jgi:hypothetical protein